MPIVQRIEKVCPVCQTQFTVPPSLSRLVCCSRACSNTHRSEGKLAQRPCAVCDNLFKPRRADAKTCSTECAGRARQGVSRKPYKERIEKVCPVCEKTFEDPPSRAHVVCCSQECSRKRLAGRPRNYSEESKAKLKGRPKKAEDTVRVCPICESEFTLPAWDPKRYCSTGCAGVSRRGKQRATPDNRIEKTCPICDKRFSVPPSLDRVVCCSRKCAGLLKRNDAWEQVRQMSDAEVAWLAGLFDGEGSIIAGQRARGNDSTWIVITITNTVKPLLDRVQKLTGVGSFDIDHRSERNPRHQDVHTWVTRGTQAVEILRQVRPWLIVKAERADAVLAGEVFPRQSRWDDIYPESADPA